MALTDKAIKVALPRDKTYRLTDGGGLYIEITPKGQKYWRYKYRYAGKEKRLAVGVYNPAIGPGISLKEARAKHIEARQILAQGNDPCEQRKLDKLSRSLSRENTFSGVAKEWYAKKMMDKAPTHQERTSRILEKDIYPFLGQRPIAEIIPRELLAVLHKIEERGAIDTAHRAKGIAGQIFRYAVATGKAERDPTPDLREALQPRNKTHFAAITKPREVGQLMQAIGDYQGTATVKSALRLSPLVFTRPGELRHMEWIEIDWEKEQWEIPKEKMKTRKRMSHNHLVPLSKQAIEILKEQYRLTNKSRYAFPSQRGHSRPMSENAVRIALRSMGYDKNTMTAHGFRTTARTLLAEELGYRPDWIEHQLAHAVKDANGEAYNRATFIKQRREMMQRWADYLDNLRIQASNPNVLTGNFPKAFNK